MRAKSYNYFLCAFAMVGLLVGCAEKTEIENEGSGFYLGRNLVEMPAEGGSAEVLYFIDNPIEGAGVEVNYECDWLSDFDLSEEGKILFSVAGQSLALEPRTADVEVNYGDETQIFSVHQFGNDTGIELKVVNTRATSFVISVVPKDPDMRFMNGMAESAILDNLSDEEIIASDMEILRIEAEMNGKTFEEYISWYFDPVKGPYWMTPYSIINDLETNTSYTAYVYGMGPDGNRLTPVYRVSTTTKDFQRDNTTEFDVSMSNDGKGKLSVSINPSDDGEWYYYGVEQYEYESLTEEDILTDMQNYLDSYMFMLMTDPGLTETPVLTNMMSMVFSKGDKEVSIDLDYARQGGVFYAFTVDDSVRIVSQRIHMQEFEAYQTESDNKIGIEVTEITDNSAKWNTTTTNQDPYVVWYGKTSDYQGMDNAQIIERKLMEPEIDSEVRIGDASGTLDGLDAGTAYSLFAFGYDDGKSTTSLFRYDFYTEAVSEELSCKTLVVKYFNGTELADYNVEKYNDYYNKIIIVVEAVVTGDPASYYYTLYNKRNAELEDSQLINLLTAGSRGVADTVPGYIFEANKMYYGTEMCLVSVAVGQDGSYSPVERNFVIFTDDGTSPVEEFEEYEHLVQQ